MVSTVKRDAKLNQARGGKSRKSRSEEDRPSTENRELTDQERLDEFRQSLFQSVLPDLPKIPGYHVCWLTTANPRDPIHGRLRLGYELIRSEELPGYDTVSLRTGDYSGCIGINEMVAAKLPMHLYESYMKEAHFTQPLAEEEKLNAAREAAEEQASQSTKGGKRVKFMAEEGMAALGEAPGEPPSFAETLGEVPPGS